MLAKHDDVSWSQRHRQLVPYGLLEYVNHFQIKIHNKFPYFITQNVSPECSAASYIQVWGTGFIRNLETHTTENIILTLDVDAIPQHLHMF